MIKHFVDAHKVLIFDATDKELCDEMKGKIDALKKTINSYSHSSNKSRLIDAIDTLSIEIIDRLLCENGDDK